MFRDATRAVKLVAAAMTTAEFDAMRLEARAGDGWTTLTELADTLVRDHGLPFQHGARDCRPPDRRRASAIRPAAGGRCSPTCRRELLGAPLAYSDEALAEILSPRHFVDVRRTLGGPAPEETARAAGGIAPAARRRRGVVDERDRRARRRPNAASPSGAPAL